MRLDKYAEWLSATFQIGLGKALPRFERQSEISDLGSSILIAGLILIQRRVQ